MKTNPKTLSAAALSFGVELAALRPLGGMDGLVCEFKRDHGAYVLKVVRAEANNPDQITQITEKLEFIHYLAENGVSVARPIPSPAGNWIESIETEEGHFLVTAATKAAGKHIKLYNPVEGTSSLFQAWGRVTGQMHALAKAYKSWQRNPVDDSTPSKISDWKNEHEFFANWCQYDAVRQKWLEIGQIMEQFPKTRAGFGLIHNDLHPWNFLVDNSKITVIDFDVCCYHWFAKDIAIALFFANWDGNPGKGSSKDDYLTDFFRNFMSGYAYENELDEFWFKQLPVFLKHHQILLFTVFTDEWKNPNKWQAGVLQKWKRQILNDIPVLNFEF